MPANAGQRLVESGQKFSVKFNREVPDLQWTDHQQRNSNGVLVSNDRWRKTGRGMNTMLRHDKRIRVNRLGFAWVHDVRVQ